MKIYIGADHAGFKLKEKLKKELSKRHKVVDVGAKTLNPKDDYPVFAYRVAKNVSKGKSFGILCCGSAEGMCIAANKVKKIRAIAAFSEKIAKLSREHNNANVLCLSGWQLSFNKAKKLVNLWLKTSFSKAPRHKRRINQIKKIENGKKL